VSLLGGALYNNNLAFLLCFFLLALFLIGMVQTHNNIRRISLEKINLFLSPSESVGHGVVWLKSQNPEGHEQLRLQGHVGEDKLDTQITRIFKKSLHPHYFEFKTSEWGKKKLLKVKISTRYPFGFFYAWRSFPVNCDYLVYPQPSGLLPLETVAAEGLEAGQSQKGLGDDFSEHRRYQLGDSQKHIDWKAYARGRPLLTKKFNQGDRRTFEIDFDKVPGQLERKARQVSQWIHHLEEENHTYSLRIQNRRVPLGQGAPHKLNCLRLLAGAKELES
jgi:uncharacterized protein (DUF58 family)